MTKPPYRVPSMAEIRNVPMNGLRVASLFSGGGGSSLGYRMAGFRVAYASEFVAAARATYMRNFPGTHVDPRDVREVRPEEVLEAMRLKVGELDVLDGSPPCAGFSELVRKNVRREDRWGQQNVYSDTAQRTDDLFREYVRLVGGIRPRAIVAENVAPFAKGVAKGHFIRTIDGLKEHGYRVKARLVDGQWLGVPQQRMRVIIVGLREDVARDPEHPVPLPYRYSVREALEGLPPDPEAEEAASFVGYAIEPVWRAIHPGEHRKDKYFGLWRASWDRPANTLTATSGKIGGASLAHPDFPRKFTVAELKRLCSFPDDFHLEGTYQQQVERMGRAVPPRMMEAVARSLARQLLPASGEP